MTENTGEMIRTVRRRLGMTQEQLAHEIQVTVSTVNRWENGHTEPSRLARQAVRALMRTRGLTEGASPSVRPAAEG